MKLTSLVATTVVLLAAHLTQNIQARYVSVTKKPNRCYNGDEVQFTQYWIPKQNTDDVDDNGNILHLTGPKIKKLLMENGQVIANVDDETYAKCEEEGTCLLQNGELINSAEIPTRFTVLDTKRYPFGQGAWNNALVPFVSVASNDLPQGTTLFVKELEDFRLPNGKVHNGCVRVDDQGAGQSFGNCHVDFFLLEYTFEVIMNPKLPEQAHIEVCDCQLLDYVTVDITQWISYDPKAPKRRHYHGRRSH
ncbi:hypothetical protein BC937DRAFT_88914 [Endogone sp. FLAS-F59071]|nr:hypothetical protein BC937DRAFT_88914 [Endogone sp. FLAS-F59071]|eukprot:RUS18337.1 hypothetical protein BC937DRAFT_88914 [Endogone sp. FLAS-F59071]